MFHLVRPSSGAELAHVTSIPGWTPPHARLYTVTPPCTVPFNPYYKPVGLVVLVLQVHR